MSDTEHPFARAVARKDEQTALRIAESDLSVHDLRLDVGYRWETPLHAAVRLKSVSLARVLLDQGMEVDAPDEEGYTPLFVAPELYAPLSVVQLLVERGADIHVRNDGPIWSAIWQASYRFGDTMPLVVYLAERGSRPSGLRHSAESGRLKVARAVTELGADVNEVDDDGHTPLDYCTGIAHTWQYEEGQHHPRVATFLRRHGAVHASELT